MLVVRAIHRLLRAAVSVFACVYVLSFLTFIGLLVYTGHAGTATADARHTIVMHDHGGTYYLTIWQSETRWWTGVIMGVSGVSSFIGIAFLGIIERQPPPD
jgi:hypothetical protein